MATKKPRLQVTVSYELRDLLGSLSSLTGRPAASFITDMLEGSKEGLKVTIAMLEASRGIQDTARSTLFGSLVCSAEAVTNDLTAIIKDSLESISSSTQAQAGAAAGVGCGTQDNSLLNGKSEGKPPFINKGVRSLKEPLKDDKGHASKLLIFKAFSDSEQSETSE